MMGRTISFLLVLNLWISSFPAVSSGYTLGTSDTNLLNEQIRLELEASLFYQVFSHYFEGNRQAFHGTAKFFAEMSSEEKGHADKLMTYMNKRLTTPSITSGITVENICKDFIQKSVCTEVFEGNLFSYEDKALQKAMELAAELEEKVYKKLTNLVNKSTDEHLKHFIEHEFLDEQIESIKQIKDYVTRLNKINTNVGHYIFDNWLLEDRKKKCCENVS